MSGEKKVVCILTAGTGSRMGEFGAVINKGLLPVDKKAIVTHIIEKFPVDTEFVVGTGYMSEQVEAYIRIAHPESNVTFVKVDRFTGVGSGPGYSLSCCKAHLQRPFYFIACDTFLDAPVDISEDSSWVGVDAVPKTGANAYCNFLVQGDKVIQIHDKEEVQGNEYRSFIGFCFIREYEDFWAALENPRLVTQERQISNGLGPLVKKNLLKHVQVRWEDVGTIDKYKRVLASRESYDFSKVNEFFFTVGPRVIKFFHDPAITERRVRRANSNPDAFPAIVAHEGQFYAYSYADGHTLYERNDSVTFNALLSWLERTLWIPGKVDQKAFGEACEQFYRKKTLERIELFRRKYDAPDRITVVNGSPVRPISALLEQLPWSLITQGVATQFHGDLQFDNILHDEKTGRFVLLDWRQDFAGHTDFGDLYYDLAKLSGGILLNYDYIKQNLFSYRESGEKAFVDFATRYSSAQYDEALFEFVRSRGFSAQKVKLLVGLIYLNMAPLHHFPFDKLLYSLGRLTLERELIKDENR